MAKLFHLTARNQANAGYKVWFWADAKFNILKNKKELSLFCKIVFFSILLVVSAGSITFAMPRKSNVAEQVNPSVQNEENQGQSDVSKLNATEKTLTEQAPSAKSAGKTELNKSEPKAFDEPQKVNAPLQLSKKAAQEKEKSGLPYGIVNFFIFLVVSAGSIWTYRFFKTQGSNETEQVNQSAPNEKKQGQSEDSLLNAAVELRAEQEPSVAPTGESEPNISEPSVSDELQKVNASIQELKKVAQEKEKLLQMNAEMHEELVGLRNGLADSIKKPLLMSLIQIYDRLEDLVKVNSNLAESEISATKILKTVNDIKLNSLDLLYEFDVEPVEPKIGDVFNPKEHKAIKTIMTDEATKDRTISSVRQIGFVNVSNSRMLRIGSVEVYKKKD